LTDEETEQALLATAELLDLAWIGSEDAVD